MENTEQNAGELAYGPQGGNAHQEGNKYLTIFLVIIVVTLMFVILVLASRGEFFKTSEQADTSNTGLSSEEVLNMRLKEELRSERARLGIIMKGGSSMATHSLVERIQNDARALTEQTKDLQAELAEKNATLADLQNELKNRKKISDQLFEDLAGLNAQITEAKKYKSQLRELEATIQKANQQLDAYHMRLAELEKRPKPEEVNILHQRISELLKRPSHPDFENLQSQLKREKKKQEDLQLRIDALIAAGQEKSDTSKEDFFRNELAKLRPQLIAQRFEIQSLRAELDKSRLFIESDKNLSASASGLLNRLRNLEGLSQADLADAYLEIEKDLSARVIYRQDFSSGSSQISMQSEELIRQTIKNVRSKEVVFLVIGYASKTGQANANRKLSAQRATTVASIANVFKTPNQEVRAFYFGATERFSRDLERENQVCEIWEIDKSNLL